MAQIGLVVFMILLATLSCTVTTVTVPRKCRVSSYKLIVSNSIATGILELPLNVYEQKFGDGSTYIQVKLADQNSFANLRTWSAEKNRLIESLNLPMIIKSGVNQNIYFHPNDTNYSTNLKRGVVELLQLNDSLIKNDSLPTHGVTANEICIRGLCQIYYYPCPTTKKNCYVKVNSGQGCIYKPSYPNIFANTKDLPSVTEEIDNKFQYKSIHNSYRIVASEANTDNVIHHHHRRQVISFRQEFLYVKEESCEHFPQTYSEYDSSSILFKTDMETYNRFDDIRYVSSLRDNKLPIKQMHISKELPEEPSIEEISQDEMDITYQDKVNIRRWLQTTDANIHACTNIDVEEMNRFNSMYEEKISRDFFIGTLAACISPQMIQSIRSWNRLSSKITELKILLENLQVVPRVNNDIIQALNDLCLDEKIRQIPLLHNTCKSTYYILRERQLSSKIMTSRICLYKTVGEVNEFSSCIFAERIKSEIMKKMQIWKVDNVAVRELYSRRSNKKAFHIRPTLLHQARRIMPTSAGIPLLLQTSAYGIVGMNASISNDDIVIDVLSSFQIRSYAMADAMFAINGIEEHIQLYFKEKYVFGIDDNGTISLEPKNRVKTGFDWGWNTYATGIQNNKIVRKSQKKDNHKKTFCVSIDALNRRLCFRNKENQT